MNIVTEEVHAGLWTAMDSDTYDGAPDTTGPNSFIGSGGTELDAVLNLIQRLQDWEDSQP
jgi:hypothetical protein